MFHRSPLNHIENCSELERIEMFTLVVWSGSDCFRLLVEFVLMISISSMRSGTIRHYKWTHAEPTNWFNFLLLFSLFSQFYLFPYFYLVYNIWTPLIQLNFVPVLFVFFACNLKNYSGVCLQFGCCVSLIFETHLIDFLYYDVSGTFYATNNKWNIFPRLNECTCARERKMHATKTHYLRFYRSKSKNNRKGTNATRNTAQSAMKIF